MPSKKTAAPIKETVLAAVIQFGRPVGLSELWDTHCKEWVKAVGGKTPKNTISRNLTTLCGENRLERVAASKKAYVPSKGQTCDDTAKGGAGDMYLYCAPGTCKAATVACNPVGAKKRAAAAPIGTKKRTIAPKKVAAKKSSAKRATASAAAAAAASSSAAAKEERGGGGEGGDFGGGGDFEPEDVEQDEPAAAAAFATAKTASSAATSSRAVKTTKKRRQAKQAASGGKRRKTTVCHVVKTRESYINSIGKLFYEGTESYRISRKSACAIDAIVREQIDAIGNAAHGLLQRAKQTTFDSRTAKMAIGMCYRGDLAKIMNLEGKKALEHDTRAGALSQIKIPAGRVKRQLKASRVASRYSANVDVFIASAINYFVAELIDVSVLVLKASKHKRLLPRDIMLAVSNDEDFRAALRGTFGGGGVVPSK